MKVKQHGNYWEATGDGDCRPIIVEGETRKEAVKAWTDMFARQYEEAARATALSHHMERKGMDYELMAREVHAYKGVF